MTDTLFATLVAYVMLFRKDIPDAIRYANTVDNNTRQIFRNFEKQCQQNYDISPLVAMRTVHALNKTLQLYPNQMTSKLFWSKFTQGVRTLHRASEFSKKVIYASGTNPKEKILSLLKADMETVRQLKVEFGMDEPTVLLLFINEVSPYYLVTSSAGRSLIKNKKVDSHLIPKLRMAHREIKRLGGYEQFKGVCA